MKQTSIEWLIYQLEKYYVKTDLKNTVVYQQAKEKHKEEIMDAFIVGCHYESKRLVGYQDVAEQYYNENYGGDNENI